MPKTNAVRILENMNIEFATVEYESSEDEIDAVSVADKIKADHEQVFKTLVAQSGEREYAVFIVPGNYELDMKKAAAAAGVKKIELIKVSDLRNLTGYIRGGCSPVGMKKLFPTYIDESAKMFDKIYVSAGVRGMQLYISPDDLADSIEAGYTDLIK